MLLLAFQERAQQIAARIVTLGQGRIDRGPSVAFCQSRGLRRADRANSMRADFGIAPIEFI